LENMLNTLHKVYYDLPEEMGPNNLYQFIKDNILDKYVGEAYIQNLDITWELHNYPSEEFYRINTRSNYRIAASRDKETKGKRHIELSVTPIPGRNMEDHFPLDEWSIETARGESEIWVREDLSSGEIRGHGFHYDLKFSVAKESPMKVRSKVVGYEQAHSRTTHQEFALPTHGISMTLIVHDFQDVRFDCKFTGIPPSQPRKVAVSKTQYLVEFNGWMIPGNSITITF